MDKNTVTGFILIAVIIIAFGWCNKPSEEDIKAQQEQAEKIKKEQKKAAEQNYYKALEFREDIRDKKLDDFFMKITKNS